MFQFGRKSTPEKKPMVPSEDYKTAGQLTKDDYKLIEADRDTTGIQNHSDEYYYNHILNYNFTELSLTEADLPKAEGPENSL